MIPLFTGIGLVIITTLTHHEILYGLSRTIHKNVIHPRFSLLFGVIGALLAHIIEIVCFAVGYYLLIQADVYGTLVGQASQGFGNIVYFSFVTYSSLGYGDITPEGQIRTVAAIEVLTGLVMIAWTASFLYSIIKVAWIRK